MRTFTRVANMSPGLRDTGDEIDAAHINELQQAAEDLQTGALPIALAGIAGALGAAGVVTTPSTGATFNTFAFTPNGPTWQDDGVFDVRRKAPDLDANDSDDWTAAIQDTVAAAKAVKGTVGLPPGTFRYDTTISSDAPITIRGAGSGDHDGNAPTVLRKMDDVTGIELIAPYSAIKGIALLTGGVASGTEDGIAIGAADHTNGAGRTRLEDVFVFGQHDNGINIKNGNVGMLLGVTASNVQGHGILLDSQQLDVGNVNAWRLLNVSSVGNGGDGIHIEYSVNNHLLAHCEGNQGVGLYINRRGQTGEAYLESNAGGAYELGASAFDCHLTLYNVNGSRAIGNHDNWIHEVGPDSFAPQLMPGLNGLMRLRANLGHARRAPTYGAFVSISPYATHSHAITVTDTNAFTVGNAAASIAGLRITIWIINASGGSMGAITWSSLYRLAGSFTNPANGYRRAITFECDGALWHEVSRSPADVSNA